MRSAILTIGFIGLAAAAFAQAPAPAQPPRPAMTLTTPAWPDGDPIPVKYTQAGEQVSPALNWTNTPPGTVSFFLHMHDPDVARNKTTDDQVHWLVWNIPGTATGLPEGVPKGEKLADGSMQISASGPVYRGPGAPASGTATSLHVRDLRARYEDRRAGFDRRVRNARQHHEGRPGTHTREGRLRGIVQTAAIGWAWVLGLETWGGFQDPRPKTSRPTSAE